MAHHVGVWEETPDSPDEPTRRGVDAAFFARTLATACHEGNSRLDCATGKPQLLVTVQVKTLGRSSRPTLAGQLSLAADAATPATTKTAALPYRS